jgi:hypothetical protein
LFLIHKLGVPLLLAAAQNLADHNLVYFNFQRNCQIAGT